MKRILNYFKREVVLTVALLAALASFLLVPPGEHTLAGIDTTTLLMLFSLMAIVAGFRHMGAFDKLAGAVTSRIHALRGLAMALTAGCFLLAMVATNDVALITLVPFTILLMAGAEMKHLTLAVVLETIAANLGSMVTPIGNPQNLYLYSSGQLDALDFPVLTWPYAALAFALLMGCCLLIPKVEVQPVAASGKELPARKFGLYGALTLLALLTLAKVVPAWLLAAAVLVLVLLLDREVLRQVDYTLLMTFVCFFVFVASVKEYAPIRIWLEAQMANAPMLVSLLVSQVISNVPACLLLSPFTQDVPALMLGVNIGGLGTLVASLASLISFRLYGAAEGARRRRFMMVFTGLNAVFLAAMLGMAWVMGAV
ncbi:MAG: citrate transporter [Clostridia bacterium]|nr:citrate transporter [Clostridia bacterium]